MSDSEAPYLDSRVWRRAGPWVLGLLLALYLALAGGSASQKSITIDELGHLPSGLYYLQTGDPRYASLNPPLVNSLSALPVLFLDLESAPSPPPPSDHASSFWSNGYHFHEMHRADYLRLFAVARWVPIGIVACLALLLFQWGRQLAPQAPELAGLLAAGFVCLSPNVIAQSRIVGTDTGTAFFVALALFCLRAMLRNPGVASTLICGLALGLAQLTKFYALLLYPVALAITLAWHALSPAPRARVSRLLGCFVAAGAISLLVLNSGYLWHEFGSSLSDLALQSATLESWQSSLLGALPLPLPGAYLRAFDGQLVEIGSSIPSYLFGESFEGGRWYFYLALLAIKTPIGLMIAFVLALVLLVSPSITPTPASCPTRLPRQELVLLLAYPVTLFLLLSISSGRQLGARALLSAVPLVWLWAGASVARMWPRRWPPLIAGAALVATLAASISTYPDYLSYFNVFVGGSEQGHRYASDANLDIGQDLVQLAAYLEEQQTSQVQLLYFGSVDPALYGIDFEIPEGPLKPGLFAVSASLYHMGYPMFDHGQLRRVGPVDVTSLGDPIARIGGSIDVYRVGPPPTREPISTGQPPARPSEDNR